MTKKKGRRILSQLVEDERSRREARIESGKLVVGTDSTGFFADFDQPDLISTYVKAAGSLLNMMELSKDDEDLGLPVFFLQRHAVELGLKLILRIVYAYEEGSEDGEIQNKLGNEMRNRVSRCHDLGRLAEDLQSVLSPEEHGSAEVTRLVRLASQMGDLDKNSTRMRYGDYTTTTLHRFPEITLPCRWYQGELEWLRSNVFDLNANNDGVIGRYLLGLDQLQSEDLGDSENSTE